MSPPEIARLFDSKLSTRLADLGFEADPAGHFSIRLAPGGSGHFEVRRYIDDDNGEIGIWPIAGVRFDEVEHLVAKLRHNEPRDAGGYTIGKPLGFLMERLELANWSVSSPSHVPGVVEEVVAACEKFGLPYMRQNSSLEAAISELSPEELGGSHDGDRLAVAYTLLGDYSKARAILDYQLTRLREGGHPGRNRFSRFADELTRHIDRLEGSGRRNAG